MENGIVPRFSEFEVTDMKNDVATYKGDYAVLRVNNEGEENP